MPTQTTENRNYQMPHPENKLDIDVARLRAALIGIDADIYAILAEAITLAGVKTFSASPLVPNLPANENSQKAVNAAFVHAVVTALVDSSPTALNTLNELAAALGDDANFATTITALIGTKADDAATTAALAGKAASVHGHSTSDITGLAAAIAAGNIKLPGDTVQRVFSEVTGAFSLTAAIPLDNTTPQSNEGTQVLTATIAPTSAESTLLVEAVLFGSETSNVGDAIIAALFKDAGADAVAAGIIGSMNGGANYLTSGMTVIRYRVTAGSTSPTTFSVRAGNNVGAAAPNAAHTGHTLGNKVSSYLTVSEIKA